MSTTAISQATHFLSPVLDKTKPKPLGQSLLQQFSKTLPAPLPPPTSGDDRSAAAAVVTHALTLLTLLASESKATGSQQLISPAEVRVVVCLLDLVVLEGIYPSLSRGVGIPIERRTRSAALSGAAAGSRGVEAESGKKDVRLLRVVVGRLLELLRGGDGDGGGGDLLRRAGERVMVDAIAGCAELGFNPENRDMGEWKERFEGLVDGTPTPQLLTLLLQLLTPQTPDFLRTPLVKTLSLIPFRRPNAIRHIIELFLSTESATDTSPTTSSLPIEALSKASKVICAVPSSVDARDYFSKICPELLSLLDSEDVLMVRAAGFVIVDVLGRKGPGIEETVEQVLVGPLISKVDPTISVGEEVVSEEKEKEVKKPSSALLAFEGSPPPVPKSLISEVPSRRPLAAEIEDDVTGDLSIKPIVSETDLSNALHRLEILLSSQPSPSVPQRIIAPIILPLWALANFAKTTGRSAWYERTLSLLKTYIKTTPDESVLRKLQGQVLYSGGKMWEFGPGSEGGVEIRSRIRGAGVAGFDVGRTQDRVQEFLGLLEDSGVSAAALNEFFLGILRMWLGRRNAEGEDPVEMFTTLKILQEVLGQHEETLAKNPTQILQIVKGVLDEYVDYREGLNVVRQEMITPSLGGLGKIVTNPPLVRSKRGVEGGEEGEDEELDEDSERNQTVMMTLSLLSVVISSPTIKLTPMDERLIENLHPPLSYISANRSVDTDLASLALNITSLLTLHDPSTATSNAGTSPAEQQKETYTLALSYLRDPLIPVRAHGLHLLRELILAKSPVIDIPTTTTLLIGTLKDNDSYVHLNAVKCLSALTDRHSGTVTGELVQAYLGDNNLGLDERLRIGEALLSTVQRLGSALVGETARILGESMVGIISRRRTRNGGKSTGEEWEEDPADPNGGEEEAAARQCNARIVKGWAASDSSEDLRIRASAMSILGAAIETNPMGLGPQVLISALEVSLAVMTLETAVEKGILRRAAVVTVGGVVKSLVGMGEDDARGVGWRGGVWEVLGPRIGDVRRVLSYLRVTDVDGLVREQAGVVLDNLETVIEIWVSGRG